MKIIKHLNDYWVAYVILIVIALMVYLFTGSGSSSYSSWRLMKLEQENETLSKMNNNLLIENEKIKERINQTNIMIENINRRDSLLQMKSDSLNQKLTQIKSQYEKIKVRVDNYDNDSVHKYFTDL